MKKTLKVSGIAALAMVFAMMLADCDNGSSGGGGKSAGATVSAPTLASKTETSITINAVAAPSNGQTVEYAKNSTNIAPASGWQDELTFSGLTANTTYYIFARSKENAAYNAGAASASLSVTISGPIEVEVQGADLAAKLLWLETNAQSNATYLITVNKDEELTDSISLFYSNKTNITVQLTGIGGEQIISNSSDNNHFIHSGVMLVLNNNITLQGKSNNHSYLVGVDGALVMNEGSKITGNTNNYNYNYAVSGYGGGVYVRNGTFTMNGGVISGNSARSGGGVYMSGGTTFTMNGGEISGNSASLEGGGVYVSGIFTMNGGEISGNTASFDGGGVYVGYQRTFTMNGGKISGNTTTRNASEEINGGGGVCVFGTFTMNDGEISGNTASYGGGVYVDGIFRIVTGTIYGTDETNMALQNTATRMGAALSKFSNSSNVAQYGTFSGDTWNGTDLPLTGTDNHNSYLFDYIDNTIKVVNGVLQP